MSKIPYYQQVKTGLLFLKNFGVGAEQLKVMNRYVSGKLFVEKEDDEHLKAAINWLCHAQDVSEDSGVSNLYSLRSGWGVSYPETSGYILATYLAYADHSGDKSYVERAKAIADWEINIQAPNGGVYSSTVLKQTRVFNTGQVILGWCTLFEYTGDSRYLAAAKQAGNYLINEQESDGTWQRDTYCGSRTYHARVDWALLRLAGLCGDSSYSDVAIKNLHWVLAQQLDNGWFKQCGFNDDIPIMHVIVYTLRGLLECELVETEAVRSLDILQYVIKGADSLIDALKKYPVAGVTGMVPASFDKNWNSPANDSCLTGNAQLACFLYRLSHCTGNEKYSKNADIILSATKKTQILDTSFLQIKGAIAGTYPLFHGYVNNGYPNWAAKFFADALLMKINHDKELVILA